MRIYGRFKTSWFFLYPALHREAVSLFISNHAQTIDEEKKADSMQTFPVRCAQLTPNFSCADQLLVVTLHRARTHQAGYENIAKTDSLSSGLFCKAQPFLGGFLPVTDMQACLRIILESISISPVKVYEISELDITRNGNCMCSSSSV
jgi:hypothetical protein